MKTKLLLISLFLISHLSLLTSQIPHGFNYQAIARGSDGKEIANTTLQVKVSILSDTTGFYGSGSGTYIWEELQSVKTNSLGLFTLTVGNTLASKVQGSALSFSAIDWKLQPLFIGTKINNSGWKNMGTSRLWTVPYSMVAGELEGAVDKLEVIGSDPMSDEALFEVKRKDGQTMFAVYNHGVRVYMPLDTLSKARKGGFAIGGFSKAKGTVQDYFVVNSDSIRAYIDTNPAKGKKGGFAIGGFDKAKAGNEEYMRVTRDSTRIYLNDTGVKARKGGFAIGGFDKAKGNIQDFMTVSQDSIRMYIDDTPVKALKGGFAIGGFDKAKGGNASFFDVFPDSTGKVYPSQNKILWYPLKNALLAGRVIAENKDSVGENSFASGFESRSKGKYSQALGYKAIARGDYSTAIGKNAIADNINSFAFGDGASSQKNDSYSFGAGAIAKGTGSYAFGSAGRDTLGIMTGSVSIASGDYSFALGQGSAASGIAAFAFGSNTVSSGKSSFAIGYSTKASGTYSTALGHTTGASGVSLTAMGDGTLASGTCSFAIGGPFTTASGPFSIAMGGYWTEAKGNYSTAIGKRVTAKSFGLVSVGLFNESFSGTLDSWVATDPIFVVGNGYELPTSPPTTVFSNALTILKNGNIGIGISSPANLVHLKGNSVTPNPVLYLQPNKWNAIGDYGELRLGDLKHYIRGEFGNGMTFYDVDKFYFAFSNVGIGTATPNEKLEISGANSKISLNSTGSNMIIFNNNGTAAPSFTSRSVGTKIVLFQQLNSTNADYALGIDAATLWYSIPQAISSASHKFYAGTSELMRIRGDGNVGIGTTAPGYKLTVNGSAWCSGTWTGSDVRWKKNIQPLDNTLLGIMSLQAVNYYLRTDEFPQMGFESGSQIGLIAQDVEKVFPLLVSTDNNGFKAVAYDKLSVVLIEAVKEQQKQIETQNERIARLEKIVEEMQAAVGNK